MDASFADLTVSTLCLFLASVAAASALHKIWFRARTLQATQTLTTLSRPYADAAWSLALGVEATAAILMLTSLRRSGALMLTGLWLAYAASLAIAQIMHSGLLDCGCSFGAKPKQPSVALKSALILAGLAGGVAIAGSGDALVFGPFSLLPAVALLLLYFLADQLFNHSREVRL